LRCAHLEGVSGQLGGMAIASLPTTTTAIAPCANRGSTPIPTIGPFGGSTHHYADVSLNSLLYRYELDLHDFALQLGKTDRGRETLDASVAQARKQAMDQIPVAPEFGHLHRDYDFVAGKPATRRTSRRSIRSGHTRLPHSKPASVRSNLSIFELIGRPLHGRSAERHAMERAPLAGHRPTGLPSPASMPMASTMMRVESPQSSGNRSIAALPRTEPFARNTTWCWAMRTSIVSAGYTQNVDRLRLDQWRVPEAAGDPARGDAEQHATHAPADK
jgi:hypothetical protein